jgi:hypothetical protein
VRLEVLLLVELTQAKEQEHVPESSRLNSRLEWQGAELLVLAYLLIEKIEAYKPYVNHPSYDLVALNTDPRRLARISVKSKWATNRAGFFSLPSLDCDFVVYVALNRGERHHKRLTKSVIRRPRILVLPIQVCAELRTESQKISINLDEFPQYEDAWNLISQFLDPTRRVFY